MTVWAFRTWRLLSPMTQIRKFKQCLVHAATYASESGTPLEIVPKVLLRHSNLSTTQVYPGKVNESEVVQG